MLTTRQGWALGGQQGARVEETKKSDVRVMVVVLWENLGGGNCVRLSQGRRLPPKTQKGVFLPLFASPTAPKPFISQFELAPGKSSVLGKACVHGSDPCFVPSLREVSLSGKVTHAITGKP